MIKILSHTNSLSFAEQIAGELSNRIGNDSFLIQILTREDIRLTGYAEYTTDLKWNDVLVVFYNEEWLGEEVDKLLQYYLEHNLSIVPVSFSKDLMCPPAPISHLKSANIFRANADRLLINRILALIGHRVRARDTSIFISYRSVDESIAMQIENQLKELGYDTWRDEAKDEFDEFGNILFGDEVQEVIEENLKKASMLLLLESPSATESNWINKEIEIALANFVPILPVCFKREGERNRGSNFIQLRELGRYFDLAYSTSLNKEDHEGITEELEMFLSDIYAKQHELPFLAQAIFTHAGYQWSKFIQEYPIYKSVKPTPRGSMKTISHCSVYDGIYAEDLHAYMNLLDGQEEICNYRLYLYGGSVLSPVQIDTFYRRSEKIADYKIYNITELQEAVLNNFQD